MGCEARRAGVEKSVTCANVVRDRNSDDRTVGARSGSRLKVDHDIPLFNIPSYPIGVPSVFECELTD
jgi:hypothetical protein